MWSQKGTCREVIAVPLEVCRQSAFGLDRRIYAILLCSAFALSHSHRSAYTNLYRRHVQSLLDLRSSIAGVVVFLWLCGCGFVVLFLWWRILFLCWCGCVFVFSWRWCGCGCVVVFLLLRWWCGGVFVFLWCGGCGLVVFFCGGVVVFCGFVVVILLLSFCGGVFVVVTLWFCGCVFVVVWLCLCVCVVVCVFVVVCLCSCGGVLCFCFGVVVVSRWCDCVFVPERLGEGRFLGAVSLSSMTWLSCLELLALTYLA